MPVSRPSALACRRRSADRGSASVSWAGTLALTVTVVAALIGSGLPGKARQSAETALCALTRTERCDPPRQGAQPVRGPAEPPGDTAGRPRPAVPPGDLVPADPGMEAPTPSGRPPGPANQRHSDGQRRFTLPSDDVVLAEDYDTPWECGPAQVVCDAVHGLGAGTADTVKDTLDGAKLLLCTTHVCGGEEFDNSLASWRALVTTHPLDTIHQAWEQATGEIEVDWNTDHEVRAVFRVPPAILGTVFGGKGLGGLRRLNAGGGRDAGPVRSRPGDPGDPDATIPDGVLPGQDRPHGAEVPDQARHHSSVRQWLVNTEVGRAAQAVVDRTRTKVSYVTGGGTYYDPVAKRIVIDTLASDGTPKSLDRVAQEFVHEAEHLRYHDQGLTAGSPKAHSREEYVKLKLDEEAAATLKEIEWVGQERARGRALPPVRGEAEYMKGYRSAVHSAAERARRQGRTLTAEERDDVGRVGGERALLIEFYENLRTSNTGEPYKDYYGRYWDENH